MNSLCFVLSLYFFAQQSLEISCHEGWIIAAYFDCFEWSVLVQKTKEKRLEIVGGFIYVVEAYFFPLF